MYEKRVCFIHVFRKENIKAEHITRHINVCFLKSYKIVDPVLTLNKAPRKEMHLKMSSAEVVCCKQLPNITDELSIEANSVDSEQTAPIGAV